MPLLSTVGLTEWLAPSLGELTEVEGGALPHAVIPWLVIAFSALGVLIAWVTVGRHRVPVERPAHVSLPVRAARRTSTRTRSTRRSSPGPASG